MNDYFQTLYSPGNQNIGSVRSFGNLLPSFSVWTKRKAFSEKLDVSKAKGSDGNPHVFFKQLAVPLSIILNLR